MHSHGPELTDQGPVFSYEGCWCPNCLELRAQCDSYSIEMIARVARMAAELDEDAAFYRQHLFTKLRPSVLADYRKRRRYLARGLKTALQRWEPAAPVIWQ